MNWLILEWEVCQRKAYLIKRVWKPILQSTEVIESYRVARSQQFNKALHNKETTSLQTPWQPWGIWKSKHNSVFLTEYHQACTEN